LNWGEEEIRRNGLRDEVLPCFRLYQAAFSDTVLGGGRSILDENPPPPPKTPPPHRCWKRFNRPDLSLRKILKSKKQQLLHLVIGAGARVTELAESHDWHEGKIKRPKTGTRP